MAKGQKSKRVSPQLKRIIANSYLAIVKEGENRADVGMMESGLGLPGGAARRIAIEYGYGDQIFEAEQWWADWRKRNRACGSYTGKTLHKGLRRRCT